MKTFHELQEGVYDPNIFKAFFLAGGPGSGKSYVVRKTTGGTGLKVVNSDDAFESLLKKAGLSLKMPKSEEEPRDAVRARANRQYSTSLLLCGTLPYLPTTLQNYTWFPTTLPGCVSSNGPQAGEETYSRPPLDRFPPSPPVTTLPS